MKLLANLTAFVQRRPTDKVQEPEAKFTGKRRCFYFRTKFAFASICNYIALRMYSIYIRDFFSELIIE